MTYLREQKLFLLALAGALGLMIIAASKFGAGNHHLLPLYPVIGFLCADIYSQIEVVGAAWTLTYGSIARAALLAVAGQYRGDADPGGVSGD